MTHQELLERWVEAECRLIWEYSSQIQKDTDEVIRIAREHAEEHGLTFIIFQTNNS